MRRISSFLSLSYLILAANVANASSIIALSFDSAAQNAMPGSTIFFTGTVTNTGVGVVDLNGLVVNLNGQFMTDVTPFFGNAPPSIAGGSTTTDYEMFTIQVGIPFAGPPGIQVGTVTLLGGVEGPNGYDPTTQNILGSAGFDVNVTSSSPEPSSVALMVFGCAALWVAALRNRSTHHAHISR
jgi:hypothetical protein